MARSERRGMKVREKKKTRRERKLCFPVEIMGKNKKGMLGTNNRPEMRTHENLAIKHH
jgi:hypothetical protein